MIEIHLAALLIMLAFAVFICGWAGYRIGWAMRTEQYMIDQSKHNHPSSRAKRNEMEWVWPDEVPVPPSPMTYDVETNVLESDLTAEYIRRADGYYGHAENLLARLRELERGWDKDKAIRILHAETFES